MWYVFLGVGFYTCPFFNDNISNAKDVYFDVTVLLLLLSLQSKDKFIDVVKIVFLLWSVYNIIGNMFILFDCNGSGKHLLFFIIFALSFCLIKYRKFLWKKQHIKSQIS